MEGHKEYEFPDEITDTGEEGIEIEIDDDTPPEDRNREPLPENIKQELEEDELGDYSEKVKIRLKQMKKVWHDERREKEQARREHNEAIAFAQKVLLENRALKQKYAEGESQFVQTYKSAAEMAFENAKREYKDAYEIGDSDKLLDAQQKLNEAQYRVQQAKDYKPAPLQQETPDVYSNQEPSVPEPDDRTVAWQKRNKWFGSNSVMTGAALGLHNDLIAKYGKNYATTDEYWDKIDSTMRQTFPKEFGNEPQTRSGRRTNPVVAPASRSTSSRRVTLKQSELAIAKRLGLTPEQYANEIIKMEAKHG